MEYRVLGPLEISHAGSALSLGGPRHRKLLAVLLLSAGEVVSSERLIAALWGDYPPKKAKAMLHVRIAEVRAALRVPEMADNGGISTQHPGYRLEVGVDALDTRRFERLAHAGHRALALGDSASACTKLTAALALWRGPALPEIADESFARGEIARLEALRLQTLEDWLEAELALGRHAEAITELEALVDQHPLHERFWSQLMLAQYRAGRQGEALRTYQVVRSLLTGQLGIEPGRELRRRHAAILDQDPALELPALVHDQSPGNLPRQLATFIGRERELTKIGEFMHRSRLVTLVGTGGAGKSRLALQAARKSRAEFPAGTWLVELASLVQPGLVVHTVASVLGVREHPERPLADLITERLGPARVLLVLDNCEHLLDEVAPLTQRLLQSCAQLTVLATSRERLGITGELIGTISGLPVPVPETGDLAQVGATDACQLLVERASAVSPGFRLDQSTIGAAAQVCRRLDGLPLALEIAAARMNALNLNQIADRLNDRFQLLDYGERTAPPRHRTLRAVFDWSYELLSAGERRLFNWASVFVGGFALEAAEAICPDPDQESEGVASLIARLVDKSLFVSEHTGPGGGRYRMLETLRMYGLERLQERGEVAQARARHADYFVSLAEIAGEELRGPEQASWVGRMELDHGNFRAALRWSLDNDAAGTAARLAGSLYPLWDLHGHYTEGRQWLNRVLAAGGAFPAGVRARVLLGSATLAVIQGDLEQAAGACEEAVTLCQEAGDPAGLAHALQYLGLGAIFADDAGSAAALLGESLSNAQAAGSAWLEAWALVFLAAAAIGRGAYGEAARLASACEAVLPRTRDPECQGWALAAGALANLASGDRASAITPLRGALETFHSLSALWGLSVSLFVCAQVAGNRGDHWSQIVLLGASERLRISVGAGQFPFVAAWIGAAVTQARSVLGQEAFDRAWNDGQGLSLDAAFGTALQELDTAAGRGPARG